MACPSCGSSAYRLITPTWVVCDGFFMRHTGLHPSGVHGPAQEMIPCGQEYAIHRTVGTGVNPPCSCNRESIGTCGRCGVPACGYDSGSFGGSFRCTACLAIDNSEAVERQARRVADLRSAVIVELALTIEAMAPYNVEWSRSCTRHSGDWDLDAISRLRRGDDCPIHGAPCKYYRTWRGAKGLQRLILQGMSCSLPGWEFWRSPHYYSDGESLRLFADRSIVLVKHSSSGTPHGLDGPDPIPEIGLRYSTTTWVEEYAAMADGLRALRDEV